MKVDDRVVRNPENWSWGSQDCDEAGIQRVGTVISEPGKGWPWWGVKWSHGEQNVYREHHLLVIEAEVEEVAKPITTHPHQCPQCKGSAYVGFTHIECLNHCFG